jgi:hypothetical protein
MKLVGFAVLAAIGGAALGLVLAFLGPTQAGPLTDDSALRRELVAAHDDLRELADRLSRVERSVGELERAAPAREAVGRLPRVEDLPSAGPEARSRGEASAALDPRRLLAEYVASFEGGGDGSEFFRMAVAAYAWQLRRELQAIAVDRGAPDALRLQVIAMLDGGSFRGDGPTIDALLELLRQSGWEQGASKALEVLARIGDRRTAELIESVASALEPLRVRAAAWGAIAELCGAEADAVLLRLFERERDPEGRAQMIAFFRGADLRAALRAYELASRMEREVRLEAAGRIGRFRDQAFGKLIDEWLQRESDEEVRARLLAAQEQRRQIPGWHELQATGPPDVENRSSDDRRAWACAQADGGREWLELAYATPLVADRVTIHETCVAGCVVSVDVLEAGGGWRSVWSGDDPLLQPGPFEVRFATTRAPVSKVRVTLDTGRRPGWNEIDAVELSGPDGSAWASHAAASTRYGESAWNGQNVFEISRRALGVLKDEGGRR